MFKLMTTFLDAAIGPDIFDDGAITLELIPQELVNKQACLNYVKNVEIKRIKEEIAYESGLPSEEVEASISTDEKQIYVDVRAHLMPPLNDTYIGRYIYRPVEL